MRNLFVEVSKLGLLGEVFRLTMPGSLIGRPASVLSNGVRINPHGS